MKNKGMNDQTLKLRSKMDLDKLKTLRSFVFSQAVDYKRAEANSVV